jgi:hypothetical protein
MALVKMPAQDLVETIAKRADNLLNIHVSSDINNSKEWVK